VDSIDAYTPVSVDVPASMGLRVPIVGVRADATLFSIYTDAPAGPVNENPPLLLLSWPVVGSFTDSVAINPQPESRNPKPETRNSKLETRNLEIETQISKPETRNRNPKPGPWNPELETRNSRPETRNPKLASRNLEPETRN
jgi:hypothetical protein